MKEPSSWRKCPSPSLHRVAVHHSPGRGSVPGGGYTVILFWTQKGVFGLNWALNKLTQVVRQIISNPFLLFGLMALFVFLKLLAADENDD